MIIVKPRTKKKNYPIIEQADSYMWLRNYFEEHITENLVYNPAVINGY